MSVSTNQLHEYLINQAKSVCMGKSCPGSCVQTSLRSSCTCDLSEDSPIHLPMSCPNRGSAGFPRGNWHFQFVGANVKCPHTKDTVTETTKSALLYWNFKPPKGINQTKITSSICSLFRIVTASIYKKNSQNITEQAQFPWALYNIITGKGITFA